MFKFIIIIILGFITGIYFYKEFINIKIHGPDSNIIKKYIYKFNDKYYKFKPVLVIGYNAYK